MVTGFSPRKRGLAAVGIVLFCAMTDGASRTAAHGSVYDGRFRIERKDARVKKIGFLSFGHS